MTGTAAQPRALRAFGATDVGRQRRVNEDRFHVDVARGIFIVVDGVGGQAAGDTAAEMAIGVMIARLSRQTGPVADRLREAITIANNEILRLASTRADWHGMACVLTAAVVLGDRAVVGHVGDSRLYRLLDGQLDKITPDHSPVGEREDARELSEFEAMHHPRRNEVYRDVGSAPHHVTDTDFVFVTEIDLPAGSALLLCSDGLTDLVPAETIRQIATARGASPPDVVNALIAAANDAGGKDNITVIYVEAGTPAAALMPAGSTPASAPPATRLLPWIVAALILLTGVGAFWLGRVWPTTGVPLGSPGAVLGPTAATTIMVRPNESIGAALAAAQPGTEIVVEPGEYRERLTLRDNIRVVSRVPRAATLRLPATASENDAAVVAVGVMNAEFVGFRIVGDAATPLGVAVITRDAAVRLVDLEVLGARVIAFDLGPGEGLALVGSHVHDNPGAAMLVRAGATPRVTHNVFAANALSDRPAAAFRLEDGAGPIWLQNVFNGLAPAAIVGTNDAARRAIERDNWFVVPRSAIPRPPAAGRAGRATAGRAGQGP